MAAQFEPVDAGRHLESKLAGLAVQVAFRFDAPSFRHQLPDQTRQTRCGQFQLAAANTVHGRAARARKEELFHRFPFAFAIARDQPVCGLIVQDRGRVPLRDSDRAITETDLAFQL